VKSYTKKETQKSKRKLKIGEKEKTEYEQGV